MISSLMEEYANIVELGGDVLGISADTTDSHASFCRSLGGCAFPLASDPDLEVARTYGTVENDVGRGRRAVYVLDVDGTVIHKVPWYQPGNVGQFMEIFQALGLV